MKTRFLKPIFALLLSGSAVWAQPPLDSNRVIREVTGRARIRLPMWSNPDFDLNQSLSRAVDLNAEDQCGGEAQRTGEYSIVTEIDRPFIEYSASAPFICVAGEEP